MIMLPGWLKKSLAALEEDQKRVNITEHEVMCLIGGAGQELKRGGDELQRAASKSCRN